MVVWTRWYRRILLDLSKYGPIWEVRISIEPGALYSMYTTHHNGTIVGTILCLYDTLYHYTPLSDQYYYGCLNNWDNFWAVEDFLLVKWKRQIKCEIRHKLIYSRTVYDEIVAPAANQCQFVREMNTQSGLLCIKPPPQLWSSPSFAFESSVICRCFTPLVRLLQSL